MRQFLVLFLIFFFVKISLAAAEEVCQQNPTLWYHDIGEWIASRTVRQDITTEPTNKILTNMKRFDVSLGKRLPIYTWSKQENHDWTLSPAISFGVDGGMAVSLTRTAYSAHSSLIFATETFDGFFGAYAAYFENSTIVMVRVGHLSAHLVDNSPYINDPGPIQYTAFWADIIYGHNFPAPQKNSRWDLYVQGSLGLNYNSQPAKRNPRAAFEVSGGYGIKNDPQSISVIGTFDVQTVGIQNEKPNYLTFIGIGRLRRPQLQKRPFRLGAGFTWGSDYRHQYYSQHASFSGLEFQTEF